MTKKKEYDDEDDEDDDEYKAPFDLTDFFRNPNKFFESPGFKHLFKGVFDKIVENFPPEFKDLKLEDLKKEFMKDKSKFGVKGPFFTGFSVNFGPDGMPKFDSFGNIKPKPYTGEPEMKEAREPLIEVNEEEDQIIIIAEMPGVTKEDIQIKADSKSLTISTKEDFTGRSYFRNVELPCHIDSDYAKARYMNGILEVKLKKIKDQRKDIRID